MAKWRLTGKHYLACPGTKWTHKETSRDSGEEISIDYPVPRYLDPDDPRFQNRDGECIVTNVQKDGSIYAATRCYYFIGPPTPEMEPLDEEATKLTEAERPKWQHPIENMEGNYSASLLSDLQKQFAIAITNAGGKGPVPSDLDELKKMVADLAAKNASLEKTVAAMTKKA
jgi:hypothetical protein